MYCWLFFCQKPNDWIPHAFELYFKRTVYKGTVSLWMTIYTPPHAG